MPGGVTVTEIDNSGPLDAAVTQAQAALGPLYAPSATRSIT